MENNVKVTIIKYILFPVVIIFLVGLLIKIATFNPTETIINIDKCQYVKYTPSIFSSTNYFHSMNCNNPKHRPQFDTCVYTIKNEWKDKLIEKKKAIEKKFKDK